MMRYVTKPLVKKSIPKRPDWSHKGDFGRLLVIGGSRTYSGAPALAALAALRSGCDLVKIAAPERAANIAASFSPDLITEPIAGHIFSSLHTHRILELAESHDAVVIGSGLGRKPETMTFVQNLLSRLKKPCVIDADAIHAASLNKNILKPSHILTPHSHEFEILSGKVPSNKIGERSLLAKAFAGEFNCTTLLKGHIDVISSRSETLLNKTGSPFMTKGGTGDILAGMCGAFLAMGLPPFNAACSAAYITGLAGEESARKYGPGLLASEVIEHIPMAVKKL